MANVLVIGGGGREQALAWKLASSPQVDKVFVAPGNAGSRGSIINVPIAYDDGINILKFVKENNIDLTVIGQEAASEAGVVDLLNAEGHLVFGPTKAANKIESSKVFSKDLMAAQNIPTAKYQTFLEPKSALNYAKNQLYPIVIKADGLAAGKGVVICNSYTEAEAAINDIMVNNVFGDSGNKLIIEEFLKGQEASFHALCDGKNFVLFPPSQDHKQAFDGDKGPNTGGMGVIAPVSWVSQANQETIKTQVIAPALKGLKQAGAEFKGCLYPGAMIDGDDVKLLEFNARFGDPEAEVYTRLIDGDLYEILKSCASGNLNPETIKWHTGFAVSVVLASPGYPGIYPKGLPITGVNEAEKQPDIVVFHAGTAIKDGQLVTAGGRVINVTATGKTLDEALNKAYAAIKLINFEGMHYRTDIGRRT